MQLYDIINKSKQTQTNSTEKQKKNVFLSCENPSALNLELFSLVKSVFFMQLSEFHQQKQKTNKLKPIQLKTEKTFFF
jgi:hypothetical protein